MIDVLGSRRKMCGGATRRDWLKIGSLGMLGVGLEDYLRLKARGDDESGAPGFGKAKSCILLLPYGSPPQHETFDPKPDAPEEVRGIYKPAATSVPGIQISEGLPQISQVMDRLTVVRSMTEATIVREPHAILGTARRQERLGQASTERYLMILRFTGVRGVGKGC